MAKKEPKKVVPEKELSLLEQINENLKVLNYENYEDEDIKMKAYQRVVCPFYAGHINCLGCLQTMDNLETCADEYRERIPHRPMLKWSPEYFAVEERQVEIKNNFSRMACDSCYFSDNCPQYKAKATCTIDWKSDFHTLDTKAQIDVLIQLQDTRLNIARTAELNDGGIPDQNLSAEMDRMVRLIETRSNIGANRFSFSVEGQGAEGVKSGTGILAQLFGPKKEEPLQIEESKEATIPITILAEPEFKEELVIEKKRKRGETK